MERRHRPLTVSSWPVAAETASRARAYARSTPSARSERLSSSATRSPRCSTTGGRAAGARRIDLGGAAWCRGSSTRTCTSRAGRSAAASCGLFGMPVGRRGARARRGGGDSRTAGWLRGRGWREEEWPEGEQPTLAALDEVTRRASRSPCAPTTATSLWVNSAALAWPGATSRSRAASSRPTRRRADRHPARGSPRGTSTTLTPPRAAPRRSTRCAPRSRGRRRRRHRRARQGRRARRARAVRRAARRRRADAAGVAVAARRAPAAATSAAARRPAAADQLRQGVHGRHARLAHGAAARRRRGAADGRRGPRSGRRARPSAAGIRARRARDRRPRQPRRARRLRGDRGGRRPLGAAPPRRARAVRRTPTTSRASPRLGITASVQYSHATSDRELVARLWADRLDHAYPYRRCSTPAPDSPAAPTRRSRSSTRSPGLRAAVLRTDSEGPAWRPEQAIPADAALRSFTVEPAWLSFDEHRRGRLRAGLRRRPRRARPRPARPPTRIRGRRSRRRNHAGGRVGARSLREPFEPRFRTATARV